MSLLLHEQQCTLKDINSDDHEMQQNDEYHYNLARAPQNARKKHFGGILFYSAMKEVLKVMLTGTEFGLYMSA